MRPLIVHEWTAPTNYPVPVLINAEFLCYSLQDAMEMIESPLNHFVAQVLLGLARDNYAGQNHVREIHMRNSGNKQAKSALVMAGGEGEIRIMWVIESFDDIGNLLNAQRFT